MPDPTPQDDIPTITVRPEKSSGGSGDPIPQGGKLSRDQITTLIGKEMPGLSKAGVEGVVRNVIRESGGNASVIGDDGTSGGLFQHHNTRLADLKAYAEKEGASWESPATQVKFAASELKKNYPTLLAQLQKADDPAEAEDSFKRVFERPASIMWENNPRLATDKYKFSDYALGEHKGRKDTSLVYMSPADYLDLSPDLEGKPFESPSGRSIKASVDRGDSIESIPSLDVRVRGTTGQVTDQDGRHRALLAQQHDIDAIPVAVRQTGAGTPTEIQGMSGNVLPNDFQKDPPKSLMSRIGGAIMPSAEAAEPSNPFAKFVEPVQQTPAAGSDNPFAKYVQPAEPDGALMSAVKGAGAGLGKTVLSGQEMVGKGLEAVGAEGAGKWLVDDARKGIAGLDQETAADRQAHPIASTIGDLAGGMVLPGGAAARIGGNALRTAAIGGALSGALQPGSAGNYWQDKALQAGVGAAAGVAGNALIGGAGKLLGGGLRAAAQGLVGEGVELTPGQMAGGAVKRAEDAMASIPILGSAIRAAQKRSIQTFNRAAINRSLADINSELPKGVISGHDAIAEAERQFGQAYNHVVPSMRGIRDPAFVGDLNHIMAGAQQNGLPQEYQDQLQHIIQTEILNRFDANGHIAGDAAQKIGTQLDALAGPMRISPNPYIQQMGRAVSEADTALDNMMAAHNPALQAAKDRIDAGYAKFKTVQRAATSAGAAPDGTFTPAQLSRAVLARDRSKDKAAFARGDAMLQDLSTAAREVLPQTVPDSGTPERAALMGVIGGAAHIEPHTAAALGLSAVPYIPPVSRAANAAMNRLGQQPGPTRNALVNLLRMGGPGLAPALGSTAAGVVPMPGNRQ